MANIPDDQRPTDEDDNDLAEVTGDLVYDLALAKITDAPTATAGDNITWRVRVYNQGNVRSGIAQVTDKLPTGLSYLSGTVYASANAPLVNSSCAVAVDGFIVTSALLVAHAINPAVLPYCVFAHRSQEPGHRVQMDFLGAEPLMEDRKAMAPMMSTSQRLSRTYPTKPMRPTLAACRR